MQVTWELLSKINESQSVENNKTNLDSPDVGGIEGLAKNLGVNFTKGLTTAQVEEHHKFYGDNSMPASKSKSYLELLLAALGDTTLLVLLAAAAVSFGLGYWQDPVLGWVEGAAIFIAVFLVSNIAAFNDYSKELQFRALEASSNQDERTSVLRNGIIDLINPSDLVVGDILIMQVLP
jgi:magnesium-transporting ATPase (P-type)